MTTYLQKMPCEKPYNAGLSGGRQNVRHQLISKTS